MDGTVDRESLRARLRDARVGIAGAGGLGSNCAAALARSGVGTLVVADFDTVSEGNLDRQFYFLDQVGRPKVEALAENLARIDPTVSVLPVIARLDADLAVELYSGCDLVIEAFDDAGAKAMLIEAMGTRLPAIPLVAASGLAGWGASGEMRVRRLGNLVLVGDESREACGNLPPMAPRVGIAAAMQANEALAILLGPMDGGQA